MNINEHPDFRSEKIEYYCNHCKKVTEHLKYLRIKTEGSEDKPTHVICCRTCAVDNAFYKYLDNK